MMTPDLMLRAVLAGLAGAQMPDLPAGRGLVHLTARTGGKPLRRWWAEGSNLAAALSSGLTQMPAGVGTLELTLCGPAEPLQPSRLTRAACNEFRGLFGLEMRAAGGVARISPLEMLTRNLGPNAALRLLAAELGRPGLATRWCFGADQWLVDLATCRATRLHRGQIVLPQTAVTQDSVAEMAAAMQGWMVRQVAVSGGHDLQILARLGDVFRGQQHGAAVHGLCLSGAGGGSGCGCGRGDGAEFPLQFQRLLPGRG